MKTKNILKIGIFSIVLFALLISPVLKTNYSQVEAESDCINAEGKCINPRSDCPTGYTSSASTAASTACDPIGLKCCLQDTGTTEIRRKTDEIKVRLPEEKANDICQEISYDAVKNACAADHKGDCLYINTICTWKASWARTQCELVIGTIEGLSMMFSGIMNSEIEWILETLDPATYGGMLGDGVQAIWTLLRNIVNSLLV